MSDFSRADLVKLLGKADASLSKAQAYCSGMMSHPNAPQSHQIGHDMWDKIEKLRWELQRRYRNLK